MKLKILPIGTALLGLIVSAYLNAPEWFGLCEAHNRGDGVMVCASPLQYSVGFPLLCVSSALLVTSFFAIMLTRKTFRRWGIFSLVYGAIITALLITVPEIGLGGGGISLTFINLHGFAFFYSIFYVILTLLVFGIMDLVIRFRTKKS